MRGEIADDCKVLSQQTWEQERVNTWTTIYHRLTVRSIFFPCPSLLSRPHRGSTTPESNESCLHNSEWSKSTPRFRPRGCRVDSKGLEGIVHAFWKLLLLRTGFKFCGFEEEGSFFEENRFNFLRF